MRPLVAALALLALLSGPATARSGCWATVELEPPPERTAAGETWTAELRVLQHGVTPLPAAEPRVTIVNAATGVRRSFRARPGAAVGVYRAHVVFPAAGAWRYEVFDGFVAKDRSWTCAQTHELGAVRISDDGAASRGPAAPVERAGADAAGGPGAGFRTALGALGVVLAAGTVAAVRRRRPIGGTRPRARA